MARYHQGKFKPSNPSKYKGDPTKIIYRSGWERKFMNWCDKRSDVLSWASEEMIVRYRSPLDGRIHRYFPDFLVQVRTVGGEIEKWMVEVKPLAQTKPPAKQKRQTKKYLNEVATYATNIYKWKYARAWCEKNGYKFVIITEKELNV